MAQMTAKAANLIRQAHGRGWGFGLARHIDHQGDGFDQKIYCGFLRFHKSPRMNNP